MTKITIKEWIFKKTDLGFGRTLQYEKTIEWVGATPLKDVDLHTEEGIEEYVDDRNWTTAYDIFGTITRETEKAILVECNYWDWRYVRYVNDAHLRKGWRVWLPKSAVYAIDGIRDYTVEVVKGVEA